MNRFAHIRGLIALAAVALSLYTALTVPVHLGLDLRAGTQIVLETRPSSDADADADGAATDRTVEVLRGRIDALGVAEPSIARSGSDRIVVERPGLQDPRKAADVLGRTAQLTFHQVLGTAANADDLPIRCPSGSASTSGPTSPANFGAFRHPC
ncbi:hypothetical protein [Streptomyces sp. NBC_00490]|uniref:hypothetical protein n=1 Tax=Streptomyces sp. NBC_00490 TaxID=2903657 RepID=UPI003FCE8811